MTRHSVKQQHRHLLSHPLVRDYLRERHRGKLSRLALEDVLADLESFGEVTLTYAGQAAAASDRDRRFTCAVASSVWSADAARGRGATPLLAALRCLMEALSETERQARHGHMQMREFLAGPTHG